MLCIIVLLQLISISTVWSRLPHIVFIVVDDLGWRDTGYRYNSDFQLTNIDNLHSNSVDLTNYYVHRVCTPTRSTIMASRYAWQNGAQKVFTAETLQHLPFFNGNNTKILPQYLKANNYQVYGVGKWHLGYAAFNMTPIERGFDNYYGFQASGAQDYYKHGAPNALDFWDNNAAQWNVDGVYSTILYDNKTIEYIRDFVNISKTDPDKSFFLYASYQTIHDPMEDPPNASKYSACNKVQNVNRTIYCHKLAAVDEIIGHMITHLQNHNLWNDTIVIFTTDNGGLAFYNNSQNMGGFSVNLPYRGGKGTLFEGGVHGNSFIGGGNYKYLPSGVRGKNNSILIHSIDWLPTIIEGILDINIDKDDKQYITGINFWNSIIDPTVQLNRSTLYLEISTDSEGARGSQEGIIHNGYKYINASQLFTLYYPLPPKLPYGNMSQINETIWLFNLNKDPFEWNNIAAQNMDLVGEMQSMIDNAHQTMGYMEFQSNTKQPDASPKLHNNTFAPWIGSPLAH